MLIISTLAVKNKFFTALSQQIELSVWLTPNKIPSDEKTISSMTAQYLEKNDTVLIISKYGNRTPADFPKICLNNFLVSVVYYQSHGDILKWITAIKQYQNHSPRQVLVLGMLKPFYVKWANKIYNSLKISKYTEDKITRHLPDVTTNIELAEKLSSGCLMAIYVGHGRSRGWSGYRGFRWNHVVRFIQKQPIGSMISLSCSSLSQDKEESVPLGIKWVMDGRNCVFLGSIAAVKIKPLEEITNIMLEVITSVEVQRMDQLIFKMNDKIEQLNNPEINLIWSSFRLVGNPIQAI